MTARARRASRPPAVRKAARPSDPSGAGTTAAVVREALAEVFHLAASQRIRIGYVACEKGEVLCGAPVALQPCLSTLFAPAVTCWLCALLAARDGIAIEGVAL
jgi:hypothetical protein